MNTEQAAMRPFHRLSLDHFGGVLISVLTGKALVQLGKSKPRLIEFLLGLISVAYMAEAYRVRWDVLDWSNALPLHLCDVLLLLGLWLTWKASTCLNQKAFEYLYFGACGGTSWAFLTPDIEFGFPHWRYFEFFFCHALVFWILAHLAANRGGLIRPGAWRGATLALTGYAVVVGALDYIFDWNYGYLRHKPSAGSLLDLFGPWPVYILWGLAFSAGLFWLLERLAKVIWPKAEIKN